MKKLLALLLLTPLVVSEEDKWWEQDLGIYSNLYDILLAETFEQREARFYGAAEDLKSLACRSEVAFNNSDRNMNKCRADAEERFVKQYKELLYLEMNQKKSGGLNFLGAELDYLEPSIAASLIVASWGSMHQECIPENQGKQNISGKVYIDGCTDKYPQLILQNLWNANRYTRVKYLERRGLLVANNKDKELIQTNELLDARMKILHDGIYGPYFQSMFQGDKQRYIDTAVLSEESLKKLSCDVVLMHGRNDLPFPYRENSLALSRSIPHADINLVGNCGHSPALEHPNKFLNAAKMLFS